MSSIIRSLNPNSNKPLKTIPKTNIKKISFLVAFALCISMVSTAQNAEDFYDGELSKMVNIPNSPEAQAFGKYGDVQVSMYSGVPNTSVPIHTIQGRELNLPLTLSYDGSGVKVEQGASWVGLSWNLNVGGRISRVTNGLPDDYILSDGDYMTIFNDSQVATDAADYIQNYANVVNPSFPNVTEATDYVDFLYDVNRNVKETQPDYFTLSVMGISETIVFDWQTTVGSYVPKVLNNPRIKVEPTIIGTKAHITGWKITGEDGTQYFFDEVEETERENTGDTAFFGDLGTTTYASSWLLTKIISKNGKDTYEFTYKDEGFEPQRQFASSASAATVEILDQVTTYGEPALSPGSPVSSSVKQKFLTSIKNRGNLMATVNFGNRDDIATVPVNTRLASIDFFDTDGDDLKSVEFDNDHYFNSDDFQNYYDIRLKLDGVTIKGKDDLAYQTYQFEYERPNDLPSQNSYAQDYFGYYNGANNNTLYMAYNISNLTFAGADREPDSYHGRTGMLTKITYPTKGHTTFEYESHDEYRSSTSTTSDPVLGISLNASSPTTLDLYKNSNGQYCDDEYINKEPKIKIADILVVVEDDYNLGYSPTGSEAFIVDPKIVPASYRNYCDFLQGPGQNLLWHSSEQPQPATIHLTPGRYKALLLIYEHGVQQQHSPSYLTLSRDVTTITWSNVQIGGNRITKITDYTKNGEIAMTKSYTYEKDGMSTGNVNYVPRLFETISRATQNGIKEEFIRYGTYAKGNEPYVVYSSVVEAKEDQNGATQGSTEYEFYNGLKGSVPMSAAPFENNYVPSLKVGNLMLKTVNEEGAGMVARDSTAYYETTISPVNIEGLVVYTEEDHFDKTIFLKEHNIGGPNYYVSLEYLQNYNCGANGCVVPTYFSDPVGAGYHSYLGSERSPYTGRVGFAAGVYGGISHTRSDTFLKDDQDNPITVSSEEVTGYDETAGSLYRPITKTVTDSKGEVYETTYTYPATGSALETKNNLVEVVKTETVKDPEATTPIPISSRENVYTPFASAVLPTTIKTQKGATGLEDRVEFDFYADGNLKSAKKTDGVTEIYVWGYKKMYPAAKIANTTFTAVENKLGAGFDLGAGGLTTSQANDLRSIPGALVTTYTYDPMVGVTSMTDPSGYAVYYEYDDFNRLKAVKDQAGQLVTDYEYRYKDQ